MSAIELNGFRLHFSSPTFMAYRRAMTDNTSLRSLRDELGMNWFLYWDDGVVYGLPRSETPNPPFGEPVQLNCNDYLKLHAARIADVLPYRFPEYRAFRNRPFTFLGRKEELVDQISVELKNRPTLLSCFKIRPKFELDARLVETRDGDGFIGLFMQVGMRWEILASLSQLIAARIDPSGLYVVRRDPAPDQRRAVGRVERVDGNVVCLSEAFDDLTEIGVEEVWLEGSKAAFSRCLKALLGAQYQRFEDERALKESQYFTAPALETLLSKMGQFLEKKSPLLISPGPACEVGSRIAVTNSADYQSVVTAPPVEYCFDAARTKRSSLPWNGLERYGPFSRQTFPKRSPCILVLCPDTVQGKVESFIKDFRDGIHLPGQQSRFSAGFGKTFGLVNPRFVIQRVPWLSSDKGNPGAAYRRAAADFLKNESSPPDAAIVIVLDEHARLPDAQNPYLHTKALLLMAGVPVQQARIETIRRTRYQLQWTLQNIAIALYAKMGGTPWTVDHDLTISDELIIGMGTVELSGSRVEKRQRFIGITTVFRGDGNYLLANTSSECSYDQYPAVLRSETTSVLREIKMRNGWQPGDTVRIVFHSYRPLRKVEIADLVADCVREVGDGQNVEFAFLTISEDHPFASIDKEQKGIQGKGGVVKGLYVPERGTIVQLGRYTRLLSTNGPSLLKKIQAPLPLPLLVHLHKESTYRDLDYLTEQILKFTSLSWRSTHPSRRPVSVYYSELIAEQLARLRQVPDWSPAMLNVKLRASRWFL